MDIINPDAMYEIIGFTPPHDMSAMGGYGFEVRLSLPFAQCCKDFMISANDLGRLQHRCREYVVESVFSKPQLEFYRGTPTLRFVGSSIMLASVEVPGVNGCWLALESEEFTILRKPPSLLRQKAVTFTTHNVDDMKQAFALLSCWLHWHRAAVSTLKQWS